MRDIVVGDQLVSDDRSGSRPANTVFKPNRLIKRISGRTGASLWFRRYTCGFSVAQLRIDNASHATTVRESAPEARRHVIGRCHVALHGRPSSSFDCQRRNSAAPCIQVPYIGNCVFRRLEKNSLFYDPRISRPLTFRSRFCRKFCDLYASIYGNNICDICGFLELHNRQPVL